MPAMKKKCNFEEKKFVNEGNFWINHDKHFFMSVIRQKKHIRSALKHMLGIQDIEGKTNG